MKTIIKFWQSIQKYFLTNQKDDLQLHSDLDNVLATGRERILTVMLRLTSILGILGIFSVMGHLVNDKRWDLIIIYLSGMIIIGIISYMRQIPYSVRATIFLTICFLLGIIDLAVFGIAEDWRLYFSGFSILTTIFLGWRTGLVALILSLIAFIVISLQIAFGYIVITVSAMASPVPNLEIIFTFSLVFFMVNGVIISAISALLNEFEMANKNEHRAVIKLEQRTAELEHSLDREQQLAQEVAHALQREEELSQLRAKIITTVSHEFRTPLTIINNSANLLDKYYNRLSPEKRQEQYGRIRSAISYLTDLLRDISIVDQVQDDTVAARLEPIAFSDFCHQLQTDLVQALDNPNNLHVDIISAHDAELTLNYNLLKQVLMNLLNNALQYAPPQAPVHLIIEHDTELIISVQDQGVGIPDNEKDKIWEPFYRGSNVDDQNGLGLGLYIVKQFLTAMSGTITLENNPKGQGTVFTIVLPLRK